MRIPIKWLNEYTQTEGIDINTLEEKMILSGSNTETVHRVLGKIDRIVVGQCKKRSTHPDADKLLVLDIDVGTDDSLQIVTGAKNVYPGDYIPVALHKSTLHDGTRIKKGKLRGMVSNGMLCSLEELGFDKKVIPKSCADGIYILPGKPEIGQEIGSAMNLDDFVIEFEITPNRPDCLSVLGMAREVSATFNKPLNLPKTTVENEEGSVQDCVEIHIQDPDLCHRFGARVIKDIKVEPSPMWLQSALMKAGMRPVNNIVDITNYVLLEWGQPLHAYDLDKLDGHKLVARRATEGEKLTTLDGVERLLEGEMLVIADGKGPVGLAGIMGGKETEVRADTKNIVIEVAHFFKSNIRKTSKKTGLRSEASSRFEKGVSPSFIPQVLDRVCHLVESIQAGTIVGGTIDLYPTKHETKNIWVRKEKITSLMGVGIETENIEKIFQLLGIKIIDKKGSGSKMGEEFLCCPPAHRLDLIEEIDFVEEVARLYGYDKLPLTLPNDSQWGHRSKSQKLDRAVKNTLTSLGANEILTYSFVGASQYGKMNIPLDNSVRKAVALKNPLGEEYALMRTTLAGNMMDVMVRNKSRFLSQAFAFELGNVFEPREWPVTGLPLEKKKLCMGLYGSQEDFFTMKGYMETLFETLKTEEIVYKPHIEMSMFHPGRCASVICENEQIGHFGEVHPNVLENYGIEEKIFIAEIDLTVLSHFICEEKLYTPLPKFPASTRDMALVVKKDVLCGDVVEVIKQENIGILESVDLFDVYEGEQIAEGFKSLAYALSFRHKDRTLTDEEVNEAFDKILKALQTHLDAELR